MNVEGQDFREKKWDRYLSEERKKAAERLRHGAEQLSLGAEVLLNRSLRAWGVQLSLPAAYTRNRYGKPYLTDMPELYVNWSHSGTWVICVLSDREAGIDLQETRKEPKESLIRRVLQPKEQDYYAQVPEADRHRLFYEYWTVKESYLKALGTGFQTSLDTFFVGMEGPCPTVFAEGRTAGYTCRLLEPAGRNYAAAVCIEGVHPELPVHPSVEYLPPG